MRYPSQKKYLTGLMFSTFLYSFFLPYSFVLSRPEGLAAPDGIVLDGGHETLCFNVPGGTSYIRTLTALSKRDAEKRHRARLFYQQRHLWRSGSPMAEAIDLAQDPVRRF